MQVKKKKKKTPDAKQYMQYKHKSHKLPTYCQVFGEGFGSQKLVSYQASNKQVCQLAACELEALMSPVFIAKFTQSTQNKNWVASPRDYTQTIKLIFLAP
jgi:hypothetical protein